MATLEAIVKAHPAYWIISFVVVVGGGTVGLVWGVDKHLDERYLRVADAEGIRKETAAVRQEVQKQAVQTDLNFAKYRKLGLEDKIFDLEAKKELKGLSELEVKQLLRYKAEHDDLVRDIRAKSRSVQP